MAGNAQNRLNAVFISGTVLVIAFSIVIGYLHIGVLYLLCIPIIGLVLGYILVWLGHAGSRAKAFVILSSVPVIASTFFLSFFLQKAEAETFLIPKDYRGEIVVFLDEECGSEPLMENGRRVYMISESGVLISKFKMNDGYLNRQFYLVDKPGNRQEIPAFDRQQFETEQEEWGAGKSQAFGPLTKETVGAFWAYGRYTYYASRNSIGYWISDHHLFDQNSQESEVARRKWAEQAVEELNRCRRQ
jgi:hypothetical protein